MRKLATMSAAAIILAQASAAAAATELKAYTQSSRFSTTMSVANGAQTSRSLSFGQDFFGGTPVAATLSVNTNLQFTGYSLFPTTTGPGIVSSGTTTVAYNLAPLGGVPIIQGGGQIINCPGPCGPGQSAGVTFTSGNQTNTVGVSAPNGPTRINVGISAVQSHNGSGAQSIGSNAIVGAGTLTVVSLVDIDQVVSRPNVMSQKEYYTLSAASLGLVAGYFGVAAFSPCSLFCGAAAAGFGLAASYFALGAALPEGRMMALSEFDGNFTDVALPEDTDFFAAYAGASPFVDPAADDALLANLNALIGVTQAANTALSRATGARASDDLAYEYLQLNAAEYFLGQQRSLMRELTIDLDALAEAPQIESFDPEFLRTSSDRLASITAVPEPATWAMLILGLGLVGSRLRRRSGGGALTRAA